MPSPHPNQPFTGTLADTRHFGFVIGKHSEGAGGQVSAFGGFILEANTEAGNNRHKRPTQGNERLPCTQTGHTYIPND